MTAKDVISFFYEDTSVPEMNEKIARVWIKNVIEKEGFSVSIIQFIFCLDSQLIALNKQYLNHDTFTDIITFNYNDEFDGLAGDIFISYERVKENALEYGVTIVHELHRVIIHGILHLLGYDDKEEDDFREMRAKENYYLNLLS